jgi:hypothetical protein
MSAGGESSGEAFLSRLDEALGAEGKGGFMDLMKRSADNVTAGRTAASFAKELGLSDGVGGFVLQTTPVVINCWLRHPRDLRAAIEEVVACGGDTDTTASILGGIIGAGVGREGLPAEWLQGLFEWPCGVAWMTELGRRLARVSLTGRPGEPMMATYPQDVLRNLFFMAVVLVHGVRRLLPPY